MTYVTVTALNGVNFGAVANPVYIIRIPVAGAADKYVVTKAIWEYERSDDTEIDGGWQLIMQRFVDRVQLGTTKFEAIDAGPHDAGGGDPVQTNPVKPKPQ